VRTQLVEHLVDDLSVGAQGDADEIELI